MYLCLPNIINPMYIEQLREMIPPHNQNTVAVCNQTTLLIPYYESRSEINASYFIRLAHEVRG